MLRIILCFCLMVMLAGCCACPANQPDAAWLGQHIPAVSGAAAPLDAITGKPMQMHSP